MIERNVDVAVIGAGSAGLRAFREARRWTDSVVLIEGGPYGTTCARVGCMPSKLLIAAGEAAHNAEKAPQFGINTGPVSVDGVAVMNRVRRERDRFVGFVVEDTEAIAETHRIRGYAKFVDDNTLRIDDHTTVHAKRIVIATGSSPNIPPPFKAAEDRLIVNDDIFHWQTLPSSVVVVGSGVIGLELGQALGHLGVKVQVLGNNGSLGPISDPVVRDVALASLEKRIKLDINAQITAVSKTDEGVVVQWTDVNGEHQTTKADYLVAATGRRPNVAGLALANTSLPVDERGLLQFDPATMRVGDSHVFVAGDVNDDRVILHEAADEGQIAGENAGRYPLVRSFERSSPMGVVFTDPQMALVGERFADLGADVVVGQVSFEDQGRSRVMLANEGIARVYAERSTGRFLGAEMFAPRAEHLGHLLAWAHQSGQTIRSMLDMPFYHPVVEEGLRTALRDAAAQLAANQRSATHAA